MTDIIYVFKVDFKDLADLDISKIVVAESAEDAITIIKEEYQGSMIHQLFCEKQVDYWKCPPS